MILFCKMFVISYTVKIVSLCIMRFSSSYCLCDTLMDPQNVFMYVCMWYVCMYICVYVCVYIYICVCVCMYVCVYTICFSFNYLLSTFHYCAVILHAVSIHVSNSVPFAGNAVTDTTVSNSVSHCIPFTN
jgi:hypothetical protein